MQDGIQKLIQWAEVRQKANSAMNKVLQSDKIKWQTEGRLHELAFFIRELNLLLEQQPNSEPTAAIEANPCSKQLPLVEALEQYIGVLGRELDELATIAVTHGWRSSRVEEGEQLRNRITELKRQLL